MRRMTKASKTYMYLGGAIVGVTFLSIVAGTIKQMPILEKEKDPLWALSGTSTIIGEEQVPLAEEPLMGTDSQESNAGYQFIAEGAIIEMAQPSLPIIAKLGTPESYSESTECIYGDLDRIYQYDGFQIATYMENDCDYICGVFITSSDIMTPEGIAVNMTKEDMESVYGLDYEEENGVYIYRKNDMALEFFVENNVISYIQYLSNIYC